MPLTFRMAWLYDEHNQPAPDVFYKKMRAGSMPNTSQITIEDALSKLRSLKNTYSKILCIIFSSGLGGFWNNVCIAAQQIMEEVVIHHFL